MSKARFVIVGNGKMAIDILHEIHKCADAEVVMGIGDQSQETFQSQFDSACRSLSIPYLGAPKINDPAVIKLLHEVRPTYIVSANNFQIFHGPLLTIAERGIINFHNGPLPRYGGLNACSWALINGEKEHGVTWHLVDSQIDTGAILAQERFQIEPDESAVSLIARCIRRGIALFSTMLPDLLDQRIVPVPQDKQKKIYYGLRDRPWDGYLPWWEPIEVLERLSRALRFHPMSNSFYFPKVIVEGFEPLYVGEFDVRPGPTGPSGTIINENLVVAVPGGAVQIHYLQDGKGRETLSPELTHRFGFMKGQTLTRPIV